MAAPVHEIRMGLIKARVWKKQTRSAERHTVSVVRLFRNGDVWKESSRFGRDDLPVVRLVLDHAHTWIFKHSNSQRSSQNSDGAATGITGLARGRKDLA